MRVDASRDESTDWSREIRTYTFSMGMRFAPSREWVEKYPDLFERLGGDGEYGYEED